MESPELGVVSVATGSVVAVVAVDVVGAAEDVVADAVVAGSVVGEVVEPPPPLVLPLPPLPLPLPLPPLPPLTVDPLDEPAADET